tara:strand:- start:302 stop:937 length:636 start_codon:yes stop_codon:yes gene_type:complete
VIKENYQQIFTNLKKGTKLIAVSKGQDVDKIMTLYEEGQRDFGENFLQELIFKSQNLPKDINWHFLGNIQSNKAVEIALYSSLIQSVSRKKILDILAKSKVKKVNILLQLKLGNESTKSGFSAEEIKSVLEDSEDYKNINFKGLMAIAENIKNEDQLRLQFQTAFHLYNSIKKNESSFNILSMGMTSDFMIALDEGSNMIRVGTKIFGARA